ncbi:MAG: DNA double-strand break repair nuclease NurA [archaeon]|nr:DNA double-strand break repair nuclease NurA [archaeon]
MHDISAQISDITTQLVEWENKIKSAANVLKEKNKAALGNVFLEDYLFIKTKPLDNPDITVAGIDGGLLKKECHGINIILTRAVCAVFKYKDMKLHETTYFPSAFPMPHIKVLNSSAEDSDFAVASSVERVRCELSLAVDMLDKGGIDFLFLDGSVALHPSLRPADESSLNDEYGKLLGIVAAMYSKSIENGIILAGIVEDSRSRTFVKNCAEKLGSSIMKNIENVKDTHLLSYCLSVGERTSIFKMEDYGKIGKNTFSFYIRPSEFDRALRVDFVAGDNPVETGSKIASAVFFMSRHNSTYGIPPVIIDADQRAKLSEDELAFVQNEIRRYAGDITSVSELRRNIRPF